MNLSKLFPLTAAVLGLISNSGYSQGSSVGKLSINSVTTSGEGCKPESVAPYISEDAQVFSLTFDNYNAEMSAATDRVVRKTCEVNLDLSVAPGWSFSIIRADARGYASIDSGISGIFRMFSKVDRYPYHNINTTKINGQYFGDYEASGKVPVFAQQWSSCSAGAKKVSIFSDLTLQRLPSNVMMHSEIVDAVEHALTELDQLNRAMLALTSSKASSVNYARILKGSLERVRKYALSNAKAPHLRAHFAAVEAQFRTLKILIKADKKLRNATVVLSKVDQVAEKLEYLEGLVRGESYTAAALMTVDTLDGEITHKYAVAWRKCGK